MELVELAGMTPEGRAELAAGEAHPFGVNDLQWRESDRYLALRDDGRLIAAAGLVVATVEAAETAFDVVGVGGVIVARPHRGKGFMRRVMEAAIARAQQLGPARAMLFCSFANSRRYARFGFREIAAPVTADQPGRIVTMGEVAMWRPLHPDATWPEGPVKVRGLPF
jgi:predicted GNAT family N-acyltransferase